MQLANHTVRGVAQIFFYLLVTWCLEGRGGPSLCSHVAQIFLNCVCNQSAGLRKSLKTAKTLHYIRPNMHTVCITVKPAFNGHSKTTPKVVFNHDYRLNAGQKYCRMLQGEHSAILLTFIKLPHSIKTFVLSIFKWLLKTGFTVLTFLENSVSFYLVDT